MFRSVMAVLVMVVLVCASMGCDENRTTNVSPAGKEMAAPLEQPGVPPRIAQSAPVVNASDPSPTATPDATTEDGRKEIASNFLREKRAELEKAGLSKRQIRLLERQLGIRETAKTGSIGGMGVLDEEFIDRFLGEEPGTAAKRRKEFEALPEEEKEAARQKFIAAYGNPYSESEKE